MSDERDKGDDSTQFAPARGADDETRFTGVAAPPQGGGPAHITFPPGSLIGHTYRIEALLARGGMGEVYRARHAELNTDHALKIILPELANNQRIVDLFRREASVLRTIRHDAVVAYDGVFRDENGRLYLVMEFADGPSLSKLMGNRTFTAEEVRQLRDRLADGLAVAHDKGVIHRDISPDNVILPGGEVDKAKIIDFGISKMADPEQKTIVGDDFAGKFSYVSPEQLGMFGGKVDGRSDIYSLGLVLAAAAQGEPLDMGQSPISVIEARRAVPDLGRVPAGVRADLAAMLQPDPAKRPQSMREMIRSQDQRGGRRSTLSEPSQRSSKQGAGRMAAIVGALAALVVVAGGAGYWYWQDRNARDDKTGTVQQTDSGAQQNDGSATSTAGQATQQTTTAANQAQTSAAGTAAQDASAGGAATQQQQQSDAGTTASSGAATAIDGGQASGSNPGTSTPGGNESGATASNATTTTTDNTQSQSQSQQASGSTTSDTSQGAAVTSGGATTDQQQTTSASQADAIPAGDDQQSSSTAATVGGSTQSGTTTSSGATTPSTTATPTTDAANDAASSGAATAAGTGTAATDTQTALLPHVPDVAKLRSNAEQAVQGMSCAGVRVDVSETGDIRAAGYVASKADRDKAAARLAALPDAGRVDNAVVVMARPLCDVLDVLRANTAFDRGLPALATAAYQQDNRVQVTATNIYRAGDHIQVTVTPPPGFEGYLYVDYIDAAESYALHLLPNSNFRPDNRVTGGQQIVIGSLPAEYDTYEIQPPFGANLIVAIASRKPLFTDMREIQESLDKYLPALRSSLAQLAAQGGGDVTSQYAGVVLQDR